MFDFLPAGFDLNDVRFYSALFVMLGLAAMTWRLRRVTRAQESEDRQLARVEAARRTGVVGAARPVERVRA